MREFHISRSARDRYQFDESLFSLSGNVVFHNFYSARLFSQKMNQKRDLARYPEYAIKASQINALGLIDEIFHFVIQIYSEQVAPQVMDRALEWLHHRMGKNKVDQVLEVFVREFPPLQVYRREISCQEYLSGKTGAVSNQSIALEELAILWITNQNPAAFPFQELFADHMLYHETDYDHLCKELHSFFEKQPHFGPEDQNLLDMLHSPAIAVPYSLSGQLEFIRQHWGYLLGRLLYKLLSSLDFIKEEEKVTFQGPGAIPILGYTHRGLGDVEAYSPDKDWMPRLVMIAKNTHVWLDQLGRRYHRQITRLDQIPNEELELFARRGFNGLWLIGLWERSKASARIKQLCGNPEAISSAYSLDGYTIAADLGGEDSLENLKNRAWGFGIRIASDMVPNHMGIDSKWVLQHPEYFLSSEQSPFPAYRFNGVDLSPNEGVGIYIDDHYFDRSDAAVVFKRVDRRNNRTEYIYHGNDGTSMPWNDTAQLNYLKPEVREAVIQTIIQVARKFPIIRFDAAMTLTKRHYQRLWFPQPGTGGDIPSRSEHGLTQEQFDALMPNEFWREVVDRCSTEAPDTLLLAEAFWLMESYFVRTLGMHRVYNSAFMNLLRNEDNARFRALIKNTLEFDPEILKRFVNFMNNPDERTAVEQFGKGDKYFGICTLMVTLPGLPMFGHGQVEGFSEKYGMEYRRAYWEEEVDNNLVQRHERDIFPLLHRRGIFSGVENFTFYDFVSSTGEIDENVFAFSNGSDNERALVVYHNKFSQTTGRIHNSCDISFKQPDGRRRMVRRTLGEALNIHGRDRTFVTFRDQTSGLEYLRKAIDLCEQGLQVNLEAYQYHVFLDFQTIQDDDVNSFGRLCDYLDGRGVPSVTEAMRELLLTPIQSPFLQIANPGYLTFLMNAGGAGQEKHKSPMILDEAVEKKKAFLKGIQMVTGTSRPLETVLQALRHQLQFVRSLSSLEGLHPATEGARYRKATRYLIGGMNDQHLLAMLGFLFVHDIGKMVTEVDFENISRGWLDEWKLRKMLEQAYLDMGYSGNSAERLASTICFLTAHQQWFSRVKKAPLGSIVSGWLEDSDIQRFLMINRYKGCLWYNKEAFEELVWWMMVLAVLQSIQSDGVDISKLAKVIQSVFSIIETLINAEGRSGYQVEKLLSCINGNPEDNS